MTSPGQTSITKEMALLGIIPAIIEDESGSRDNVLVNIRHPLSYPCPMELLPIGVQTEDAKLYFKPLIQIAIEGMVRAGVEYIVIVLTDNKWTISNFCRDGRQFGVPISYVSCSGPGLSGAIDATYAMSQGHSVVMALPGIVNPGAIVEVVKAHRSSGGNVLSMSVSQNTRISQEGMIKKVTRKQMTGVFMWEPQFTELHRELTAESGDVNLSFEDIVAVAISEGMCVKPVKLPFTPFVNDSESWSKIISPDVNEPVLEDD